MDLALNNLQRLISHKAQTTKQQQKWTIRLFVLLVPSLCFKDYIVQIFALTSYSLLKLIKASAE